jgi:hypothetical protein
VTVCGKKHVCSEKASGGKCAREEKEREKNAQAREDVIRAKKQAVLLDLPFYDSTPEYLDLQKSLGGLRISAERCLDIDTLIKDRDSREDVLTYARKVIKGMSLPAFYVGVTEDPSRRLSQHSRRGVFSRMIVIAKTSSPTVVKTAEKFLISKLKPSLNISPGGEGIHSLSEVFYLYLGHGVNRTGHELRV